MALKPNTIKALFGKLAPYADDVARGVANYGDDVARAVTPYADDVAGLMADNAGRAAISPELLSDSRLDFADALADGISTRRSPTISSNPNASVAMGIGTNPHARRAVQDYNINTVFDDFGHPVIDIDGVQIDNKWFSHPRLERLRRMANDRIDEIFGDLPVESLGGPRYSTKERLLDDFLEGRRSYDVTSAPPWDAAVVRPDGSTRPHANTALGRWWRKQNPGAYLDPIGPLPYILDDLPF